MRTERTFTGLERCSAHVVWLPMGSNVDGPSTVLLNVLPKLSSQVTLSPSAILNAEHPERRVPPCTTKLVSFRVTNTRHEKLPGKKLPKCIRAMAQLSRQTVGGDIYTDDVSYEMRSRYGMNSTSFHAQASVNAIFPVTRIFSRLGLC